MAANILKGFHVVQGFLFPLTEFSEAEVRKRILLLWNPGVRVLRHETANSVLVLLEKAKLIDCSYAPGCALIKTQGVLSSIVLKSSAIESMSNPSNYLLVMMSGVLQRYDMSTAVEEDPSTWLDVNGLELIPVQSLGRLPAPPETELTLKPEAVHQVFSNDALKPSKEREDFLSSLQGGSDTNSQKTVEFGGIGRSLVNIFQRLFRRKQESGNSVGDGVSGTSQAFNMGREPGKSFYERISGFFSRVVMSSKLGKFLSKRQARYFRNMMDKFESGDIQDALRHAVPLASARDVFQPSKAAFGLPNARTSLDISYQSGGSASSYHFGESFYAHLEKLYRSTFYRLDRAGRIQEAAFVLAELLQATEEAVSYLEKQGEFELAAKLAEGREADPALIIRQWFLAGEVTRAVQIAKRTGQFSQAVKQLQATHPAEAEKLRLLWAQSMVSAGQYAKAVDIVWQVDEARSLALNWAGVAIREGGESGARMLARKIAHCPDEYGHLKQMALALLANETTDQTCSYQDPSMAAQRLAFAKALLNEPGTPESSTIARQVYRAMLRDRGYAVNSWKQRDFDQLSRLAQERALHTDLPNINYPIDDSLTCSLRHVSTPEFHALTDSGTLELWCAVALPKQRVLLAEGEAGVSILNTNGKVSAHFAVPAHQLVVSDSGNRAIALAQRGEFIRLSKIDLSQQRSQYWCDVRLDHYCSHYDGVLWFVAMEDRLLAIDVEAEEFKSIWQISELPGHVIGLTRSQSSLAVLMDTASQPQVWRYDIPKLMLRQRTEINCQNLNMEDLSGFVIDTEAKVYALQATEKRDGTVECLCFKQESPPLAVTLKLPDNVLEIIHFNVVEEWLLIQARVQPDIEGKPQQHLFLYSAVDGAINSEPALEIHLSDVVHTHVGIYDQKLSLCDSTGQVALIDLVSGHVIWQHRL